MTMTPTGAFMEQRVSMDPRSCGETGVLLVRMPFGALDYPSIGLSLLKAGLARKKIGARIRYLSATFGGMVGSDRYHVVSRLLGDHHSVAGDWLFAGALYGHRESASPPRFLADATKRFAQSLGRMRRKVDRFLDIALEDVVQARPRIVGFSCVYQQRVASLALAKRLKALHPDTFVVFGGPECASVKGRELLDRFPFVDAVVPGEGDVVFPALAERVLRGEDWADLEGVYGRQWRADGSSTCACNPAPLVRSLDELPFPDYDDYFEQLEASDLALHADPFLLVEGSRGCWWGKCRFCSLNGVDATYRTKSPGRLLEEVAYLNERHGAKTRKLFFVDNVLNVRFLRDLFPSIADRELGLELSLEVKSNLRKHHLRVLSAAGVTRVQPGIESLSTPILKLMNKGVSALQNIQILKWCKEFGVEASWNIIWGFPGERPEQYVDMARYCTLLTHLDPPTGFGRMALGRHSEYYTAAAALGLENIAPDPAYYDVFPFDAASVACLAEFFTFDYRDGNAEGDHIKRLWAAVHAWKRTHGESEFFYADDGERLLIWDERGVASDRLTRLSGMQGLLYRACDIAKDLAELESVSRVSGTKGHSREELETLLQPLLARGLMIREGKRYLALAIPVGVYTPPAGALKRFRAHLDTLEAQARQKALLATANVRSVPTGLVASRAEIRHCLERLGRSRGTP